MLDRILSLHEKIIAAEMRRLNFLVAYSIGFLLVFSYCLIMVLSGHQNQMVFSLIAMGSAGGIYASMVRAFEASDNIKKTLAAIKKINNAFYNDEGPARNEP